jgi:hypothetical protein
MLILCYNERMAEFNPATPVYPEGPLVGPDELFPQAPDSVRAAYETYWRTTHASPETARSEEMRMTRVNTLLGDFGQRDLHPYVYTAAMLGKIYDQTDDYLKARTSMRALKQYLDHPETSEEEGDYVLGLLSGRRVTRYFWDRSVQRLHDGDMVLLPILLDSSNAAPVSNELWLNSHALARTAPENAIQYFVDLNSHSENVDTESMFIDAAEALAWLDSDAAGNDSRTFQVIHKVEVLLAPLCEFMGFTALASHLRSETLKRRLINGGDGSSIDRASHYLESLGCQEDIERQTQTMIEIALGEQLSQRVVDNASNHGIVMGEGLCTPDALRIEWRMKSLGSLAQKLSEYDEYAEMPMDIIAATVIVSSETQVANLIAHIVERVNESPRTTPWPSPSKEHALHISGDPAYINAIIVALGGESIDAMRHIVSIKETSERGFHVAKLTFVYSEYEKTPLRTEIMVTTAQDRREARIGIPAHALYKLGVAIPPESDTTRLTGAFSNLKSRRKIINKPTLTPRGMERSKILRHSIDEIS